MVAVETIPVQFVVISSGLRCEVTFDVSDDINALRLDTDSAVIFRCVRMKMWRSDNAPSQEFVTKIEFLPRTVQKQLRHPFTSALRLSAS